MKNESADRSERPLILITDENQVTLRLIEGILSDSGYSVVTADSGENALAIYGRDSSKGCSPCWLSSM